MKGQRICEGFDGGGEGEHASQSFRIRFAYAKLGTGNLL